VSEELLHSTGLKDAAFLFQIVDVDNRRCSFENGAGKAVISRQVSLLKVAGWWRVDFSHDRSVPFWQLATQPGIFIR
jgi:hypothetical protein